MGTPVKIVDLARELIRLSGLRPDIDIPIVFTGIRPGEKIAEEILTAEEGSNATKWEKLFINRTPHLVEWSVIQARLQKLADQLASREDLKNALDEFIDEKVQEKNIEKKPTLV
jgi:FlaA1/EpsC-like NDP-sugar epimerase